MTYLQLLSILSLDTHTKKGYIMQHLKERYRVLQNFEVLSLFNYYCGKLLSHQTEMEGIDGCGDDFFNADEHGEAMSCSIRVSVLAEIIKERFSFDG